MTQPTAITVTVSLGGARKAADLLAFLLEHVEPSENLDLDAAEFKLLRSFASAVAGPVYGNPLGHALERFEPK